MSRRNRTLAVLAAASLAALAALASAFVVRVDEGEVGVTRAGRVLPPGLHVGSARVVAGAGRLEGGSAPTSREGAAVAHRFAVSWHLDLEALPAAAARLAKEGPAPVARAEVQAALQRVQQQRSAEGAGNPAHRAAAEAEVRSGLAAAGLGPLSVEIEVEGAAPDIAALVRPGVAPVLLVGVDGMDRKIADPLLAAGRMPHLAALIAAGTRADLRSARPMLSPLIWTTMATGRRPEDHGILDFLAVEPSTGRRIPITSHFRQVPALWNIATAAGLPSAFVGWWATWPPEPVLGALVTDRLAFTVLERDVDTSVPDDVAFPPALAREALRLAESPADIPEALLARLVGKDAARDRSDEDVTRLARDLAGALTYHRVALHVLRGERFRIAGVYYELVDQVCHRFMHAAPPRRPGVSEEDFVTFSRAVDAVYELQDELLGELLASAPSGAVVILVSDHGFLSGAARPQGTADVSGKPGLWHRGVGVLVVAGPGVIPAASLGDARVEDIAPTVLHIAGLPVGQDMPGRPLLAVGAEVARVGSWSDLVPMPRRKGPAPAGELDAAAVEQLAALGYVGKGSMARHGGPAATVPGLSPTVSWHLNRAYSLLEAGRNADAAQEALDLAGEQPLPEALSIASRALERQGDGIGALEASRRALAMPGVEPGELPRHVELLLRAGKVDEARAAVEAPTPAGTPEWQAARFTSQGLLAEARGDGAGAMALLRQALEADPSFAPALAKLVPIAQREGTLQELAPLIRSGLSGDDGLAAHHEALGLLALAENRPGEAVRELREALATAPGGAVVRARLASALMLSGDLAAGEAEVVELLRGEPREGEAWLLAGAVLGRAGRGVAALEAFARARELGATEPAAWIGEVVARLGLGDEEGARRVVAEGRSVHPRDAALLELERDLAAAGR